VNLFQFAYFHVSAVEIASSINVAEVVLNIPLTNSKRNQGYGDNIGDGQIVPSTGQVFDPDQIDAPVDFCVPPFHPARGVGL
jgi:cell division septation protein DedD